MNSLKKYFMIGSFAISTIAIPSYVMETTTHTFDPALVNAVVEEVMKRLQNGQVRFNESIAENFTQSAVGFTSAGYDALLGISRFTYNGSVAIADWAKYLSQHYVVLGALLAGSACFYWYIWPKIEIRVNYNSNYNTNQSNQRPLGR